MTAVLAFFVLGFVSLGSGARIVLGRGSRDATRAFAVHVAANSGLLLLLGSPVLAALQLLVGLAGIYLLFLGVLAARTPTELPPRSPGLWAGLTAILLAGILGSLLADTAGEPAAATPAVSGSADLARTLLVEHPPMLPLVGLLLLVSLVAVAAIAGRGSEGEP